MLADDLDPGPLSGQALLAERARTGTRRQDRGQLGALEGRIFRTRSGVCVLRISAGCEGAFRDGCRLFKEQMQVSVAV
jgi:hypothetical protein